MHILFSALMAILVHTFLTIFEICVLQELNPLGETFVGWAVYAHLGSGHLVQLN